MANELKQARAELESAQRAIDAMNSSESMERFEAEWRYFLSCIEKSWVKVERSCESKRNEFQPWQGKFQSLRKKDMLLRYLKQARDADNHSVQDLADIEPGKRLMNFVNPAGGYVKSLKIDGSGNILHYEGDPMVVVDKAPQPIAVRVKNNGEWFNPPNSHLGQPITSQHPVNLANLGLAFYIDFLKQAEKKFFI